MSGLELNFSQFSNCYMSMIEKNKIHFLMLASVSMCEGIKDTDCLLSRPFSFKQIENLK